MRKWKGREKEYHKDYMRYYRSRQKIVQHWTNMILEEMNFVLKILEVGEDSFLDGENYQIVIERLRKKDQMTDYLLKLLVRSHGIQTIEELKSTFYDALMKTLEYALDAIDFREQHDEFWKGDDLKASINEEIEALTRWRESKEAQKKRVSKDFERFRKELLEIQRQLKEEKHASPQ